MPGIRAGALSWKAFTWRRIAAEPASGPVSGQVAGNPVATCRLATNLAANARRGLMQLALFSQAAVGPRAREDREVDQCEDGECRAPEKA